jgi:hypothetical protein
MPKKSRKRFTAQEKVAILRLHLLEQTPISDLCDQHGIHPTMELAPGTRPVIMILLTLLAPEPRNLRGCCLISWDIGDLT